MMTDQVFARAMLMAGELDSRQQELLRILCEASFSSLEARLREGLAPEDCREPFITAAGFQALAALGGFGEASEFRAGDLTVKLKDRQGDMARELRYQADALMGPYLKDTFLFAGV